MKHVYRTKPSTSKKLKQIIEDFIKSIDPAFIRKACVSSSKRLQIISVAKGRRFEHKKNALRPLFDGDN